MWGNLLDKEAWILQIQVVFLAIELAKWTLYLKHHALNILPWATHIETSYHLRSPCDSKVLVWFQTGTGPHHGFKYLFRVEGECVTLHLQCSRNPSGKLRVSVISMYLNDVTVLNLILTYCFSHNATLCSFLLTIPV